MQALLGEDTVWLNLLLQKLLLLHHFLQPITVSKRSVKTHSHTHPELKIIYIYIINTEFYNKFIVQELCESRGGRPGCPNEPSGFRGRNAILNRALALVTTCP